MRPDAAHPEPRKLRSRPGRCAARRSATSRWRCTSSRPAPPLSRAPRSDLRRRHGPPSHAQPQARLAALRRRPRALRPDRLAGARGAGAGTRADCARHRPGAPAHAPADRGGAAAHRPARGRLFRARAAAARPARARARAACCRAGVDMRALQADRRERRRARSLASSRSRRCCCSRPTRRGPEKRFDRAHVLAQAAGASCSRSGSVAPRARAAVDQRRRRRRRALRAGGLRPGRARGARLRGARARDPGRHPRRGARGRRRARCARPFELERWRDALRGALGGSDDPRVVGRERAAQFSSAAMAERVRRAWQQALAAAPATSGGRSA